MSSRHASTTSGAKLQADAQLPIEIIEPKRYQISSLCLRLPRSGGKWPSRTLPNIAQSQRQPLHTTKPSTAPTEHPKNVHRHGAIRNSFHHLPFQSRAPNPSLLHLKSFPPPQQKPTSPLNLVPTLLYISSKSLYPPARSGNSKLCPDIPRSESKEESHRSCFDRAHTREAGFLEGNFGCKMASGFFAAYRGSEV